MRHYLLISIHPEHVSNIISGKKVFEYRKVIPNKKITHLVLYCTAPVKKIVAVAEVLDCLVGSPSRVWDRTSYGSGISRQFFRDYFIDRSSASAFFLGNVFEMKQPIGVNELTGKKVPPQSFCYLNNEDVGIILSGLKRRPAFSSSTLFIGGIHGVGKSTISDGVFSPLGYQCETASSLIAMHGKVIKKDKLVSSVYDNQTILLEQVKKFRKRFPKFLLDGHFTLINEEGKVDPIHTDVFRAMELNQLLLIRGEVGEISRRLALRDGKKWSKKFLEEFQHKEEAHARHVSEAIEVPLQVFDNTVGYAELARKAQG